jgi:GWxTD domain-containing protein
VPTLCERRRPVLRCLVVLIGLALVHTGFAQGPTLRDLFQKGKNEFKQANYRASLATFQALERASLQPENEASREELRPIVAFYSGANLAALGEADAARKEFDLYLTIFPAARLDPAAYPTAVVELFRSVQAARQKLHPESPAGVGRGSGDGGIAAAYARFSFTSNRKPAELDETWTAGPVRFLMSQAEKITWQRTSGPVERAEFVTNFWRTRDPNPLTPENELQEEFEKRVAFADTRFTDGEKSGSETDRGMVFVLLGPPNYAGQTPLKTEEDPLQSARAAPVRETSVNPDRTTTTQYVPRNPLSAQRLEGTREVWHYKRDRLPNAVRFAEVDFEFISKEGYGNGVLQRDQRVLAALDEAVRALSAHR